MTLREEQSVTISSDASNDVSVCPSEPFLTSGLSLSSPPSITPLFDDIDESLPVLPVRPSVDNIWLSSNKTNIFRKPKITPPSNDAISASLDAVPLDGILLQNEASSKSSNDLSEALNTEKASSNDLARRSDDSSIVVDGRHESHVVADASSIVAPESPTNEFGVPRPDGDPSTSSDPHTSGCASLSSDDCHDYLSVDSTTETTISASFDAFGIGRRASTRSLDERQDAFIDHGIKPGLSSPIYHQNFVPNEFILNPVLIPAVSHGFVGGSMTLPGNGKYGRPSSVFTWGNNVIPAPPLTALPPPNVLNAMPIAIAPLNINPNGPYLPPAFYSQQPNYLLTAELHQFIDALTPDPSESIIHQQIHDFLSKIITDRFSRLSTPLKDLHHDSLLSESTSSSNHHICVERFGSTISGFSLKNADLDFCVFIKDQFPESSCLSAVADAHGDIPASGKINSPLQAEAYREAGGDPDIMGSAVSHNTTMSEDLHASDPFLSNSSIISFVADDPKSELASKVVTDLGKLLSNYPNITNLKVLSRARIPIIKFTYLPQNVAVDGALLPNSDVPSGGIHCDIGVNNTLALYNTRLLQLYSKLDPRVKPLALLVKYWSKMRRINEPYLGTLSSYCWLILVIHYLQSIVKPSILPVLQAVVQHSTLSTPMHDASSPPFVASSDDPSLEPSNLPCPDKLITDTESSDSSLSPLSSTSLKIPSFKQDFVDTYIDGHHVKFLNNIEKLQWNNIAGCACMTDGIAAPPGISKSTLGETNTAASHVCSSQASQYVHNEASLFSLLQGFFKYYAYDFSYSSSVVSINRGSCIPKSELGWTVDRNSTKENYWFCVQDPFEIDLNLARMVSRSRYCTPFVHAMPSSSY